MAIETIKLDRKAMKEAGRRWLTGTRFVSEKRGASNLDEPEEDEDA